MTCRIWAGFLLALPLLAQENPSLESARALFDARRYAEAQLAFEQLPEDHPEYAQILLHLGELAVRRQEWQQGVDYLEQAVALDPADARIQFEYAAACGLYASTLKPSFKALRHARRASRAFRQAIELEPDRLDFRQGLIEFCLSAPRMAGGGMARAHEQVEAITARDPIAGALTRARVQRVEKNDAGALATLDQLIAIAPDHYLALFQFGRTAAESGERLPEGLVHLQTCLGLPRPPRAPALALVWRHIALIQKALGDRAAAIAAWETAVFLAPQHQRLREELAHYRHEES